MPRSQHSSSTLGTFGTTGAFSSNIPRIVVAANFGLNVEDEIIIILRT